MPLIKYVKMQKALRRTWEDIGEAEADNAAEAGQPFLWLNFT